jgi:hypothetical protein
MKRAIIMMVVLGFSVSAQTWAQWTNVKRLTWTSGDSYAPAIAADSSGKIHLIWDDDTPGQREIYYKRSTDEGITWEVTRRLTWTSNESLDPAIAVNSSDQIHVVWADSTLGNFEIYYKSSADGGLSWTPAKRLTWTLGSSEEPAIAVDSNNQIMVVWSEGNWNNREIFSRRSLDGGAQWGPVSRLTWMPGGCSLPAVAIDASDKIHLVWAAGSYSDTYIYYLSSVDGINFVGPQTLSNQPYEASCIAMAISGNTICATWQGDTDDLEPIYYRLSIDGGGTWSAVMELPTYSRDSYYGPAIGISGNTIHVVWEDWTPGYPEIYYMKSKTYGAFWSPPVRLTWTMGDSYSPAIAVDSNDAIHVFWRDNTPRNYEIYYKKRN